MNWKPPPSDGAPSQGQQWDAPSGSEPPTAESPWYMRKVFGAPSWTWLLLGLIALGVVVGLLGGDGDTAGPQRQPDGALGGAAVAQALGADLSDDEEFAAVCAEYLDDPADFGAAIAGASRPVGAEGVQPTEAVVRAWGRFACSTPSPEDWLVVYWAGLTNGIRSKTCSDWATAPMAVQSSIEDEAGAEVAFGELQLFFAEECG